LIAAARQRSGLLLGVVVCGGLTIAIVAPLVRSGTLLLLDYGTYPVGPQPQLDSSVWGFPPGLVTRAPVDIVLFTVFRALDWGWFRLLPFILVAPLSWVGFRRLLGPNLLAVAAATTLFVINPWTDDRMSAGQVYLVVGYALLPLLASMLFARATNVLTHAVLTGLVVALLVALAPHFIFVAGLLVLIALIVAIAQRDWRRTQAVGGALAAVAAISVYWLIPALVYHPEALPVTNADLAAFQTTPDPYFGLGLNVLGLYGFWRPGEPLAKDALGWWPLILLAILVLVGLGAWFAWKHLRARAMVTALGVTAILAYLLALGDQGPTGGLYAQLYDHLPGFAIMREAEKFSALLALAFATFFGLGAYWVSTFVRPRFQRGLVVVLALLIPCVYGFTVFWGFDGYAAPSTYPESWAQANTLMGTGDQPALALPWHLYLSFSWTQGRTVVNPMASYFTRPVISGDNIEAGDIETESSDPRSAYLEYLISIGPATDHLGRLLAPLGIRYILLAKTDDWRNYGFLYTQSDLRVVRNWSDLTLFQNREPAPLVTAPTVTITVDNWGDVVGLAQEASLTSYYVVVRNPGPGPIREPDIAAQASAAATVSVSVQSPVQMTVSSTSRVPHLVIAEPFDSSWLMDQQSASEELGAIVGFSNAPSGTFSVDYGRWPTVRDSYIASAVITLALVGLLVVPPYWRRRRRPAAKGVGRSAG
jgi:hypothetical protein